MFSPTSHNSRWKKMAYASWSWTLLSRSYFLAALEHDAELDFVENVEVAAATRLVATAVAPAGISRFFCDLAMRSRYRHGLSASGAFL